MAFGLLGAIGGIILIVLGVLLVVVFPGKVEHQTEQFGAVGIILGFVFLIAGGILLFG